MSQSPDAVRGALAGPGVRALLVGTGTHAAGSPIPDVPAVADTVTDLAAALTERCGLAADHTRTLIDPRDPLAFGQALNETARQADDLLFFYYVGHGLLNRDGELHLATRSTDHFSERLGYTSMPYATVRKELAECRARSIIVILDCCFSGRAGAAPGAAVAEIFASAQPPGGCLLVSASPEEVALAPAGERNTAFTGELIRLLRRGDPAGPTELTLDYLYRCLDRDLPEQGRPRPHRQLGDRAGDLVLAPNPAYRPPVLSLRRAAGNGGGTPGGASPYPGLAAFGVTDARYFFGREELTERLVQQIARRYADGGPLTVVGPSGSGKSSLLRAGLVPELEQGVPGVAASRSWPRLLLTPGAHPLMVLASRLAGPSGERRDVLYRRLAEEPDALSSIASELLVRHTLGGQAGGRRLVLIVDQFEQVFTDCTDSAEQKAFTDLVCAAAGPRQDGREAAVIVVLGVRADFYGRCAADPRLARAFEEAQVVITPMTTSQLRSAIEGPAAQAGLRLEDGLPERLLQDVHAEDGGDSDAAPAVERCLPLLSHVLLATWQNREGHVLTLAGYQATGGVWRAVARTADTTYAAFTPLQQQVARQLLLRMVRIGEGGVEDTRCPVRLAGLGTAEAGAPGGDAQEATAQVLNALADARLVTVGTETAEITHEALLQAWPQLRLWIDGDRAGLLTQQHLIKAADDWQAENRDASSLYSGARLATARQWAANPRADLPPQVREFLAASIKAARRRTRTARTAVTGLAVLLIVSLIATVIAVQQRGDALQRSAQIASTAIAQQADTVRPADPSLATQLALAAYRTAPTAGARSSLLAAGGTLNDAPLPDGSAAVLGVAYSPDGRLLASSTAGHVVRLWDMANPRPHAPVAVLQVRVLAPVAFSPGGRLLAAGGRGSSLALWNITDPRHPAVEATIGGQPGRVPCLAISSDGKVLAVCGRGGAVELWDIADPRRPALDARLLAGSGDERSVAFSPDGKILATDGSGGAIRLWSIADPDKPTEVSVLNAGAASVTFRPHGHVLAAGRAGGDIKLWNVADPAKPVMLTDVSLASDNTVRSLTFSRAGDTLAAGTSSEGASSPGAVQLVDASPPQFAVPGAATSVDLATVSSVAFSPAGLTVASGEANGALQLWGAPVSPIPDGSSEIGSQQVFSPDGRMLAVPGDNGTVRMLSMANPDHPTVQATLPGPAGAAAGTQELFFVNDHTFGTVAINGTTRLWNLAHPRRPALSATLPVAVEGGSLAAAGVTPSPDGRFLVLNDKASRAVELWGVTDPRHPVREAILTRPPLPSLFSFSSDGRTLAITVRPVASSGSVILSGTVQLWDVADPHHPVAGATLPATDVMDLHLTGPNPAGHTLITQDADGAAIRLWNVTDLQRPTAGAKIVLGDPTFPATVSPDGRLLALPGRGGGALDVWDVSDAGHPARLATLADSNTITALQFSPDSRIIASAEQTRQLFGDSIQLWDLSDPATPAALATISPSDVTGSGDIGTSSLVFSPDSRVLTLSGYQNGIVPFWDLDSSRLARYLCSTAGTMISRTQWRQYIPDLPYRPPCS